MKKIFTIVLLLILFGSGLNAQTVYCSAGATYTSYEYIETVSFNTIYNVSSIDPTGYSDYTYLSAGVTPGVGYTISVSVYSPWSSDECDVYVDWNQDNSFYGLGEHFALSSVNGNATFTGIIMVPPAALAGPTRMRVMLNDAPPSDPCTDVNYGEVEDYTLLVIPSSGCIANAQFNSSSSSALSWSFALMVTQSSLYNVLWTMGDGTSYLNVDQVAHTYLSGGSYLVTCTVTDPTNGNCTDTYSYLVLPSYCPAWGSIDEYISEFDLNTIFNSSGYTNGYQDFTYLSTGLAMGMTYPVSVVNPVPYSSDAVGVWVDWNQDYSFSGNDEFLELISVDGGATFTGLLTVPLTASLGLTTLRTRIVYSETLNPCGVSNYGEVEDYTVDILPPGCMASAQFSWSSNPGCEYEFYTNVIYPSSGYSFLWDFGDGTVLSGTDWEDHIYATSGYYTVQLTVTDLFDQTCYDYASAGVNVNCSCSLDAEFTWYQTQIGCEYGFYTNNIYPSSGYYVDWYFGDGNWAYYYDYVYHTYTSSGYYWVSSYVEDLLDNTCYDLYEELIYVYCTSGCYIEPSFSIYNFYDCEYEFYTNYVYPSSGYFVAWDFGDGTYEIWSDYTYHSYASSGLYWVSVYIEDLYDPSCYASAGQLLYASCGSCYIDAEFTWYPSEIGCEYIFYTYNYYPSSGYYVDWYFGDGNWAFYSDYVYYTYASGGYYWVSSYVEDLLDPSCNDLYEELIYIYCTSGCSIVPTFTVYDYLNCEYEFYTDYIYPSSGYFVAWDFGDGSYELWTNYTYHTYASSGWYWVTVYIEDLYDPSCYASAGQYLYASCGGCYIDAEFTWYQSQIGCEYVFYTNNIYPSSGYYVDWYFGDGNWAYYYDYVYHTFASSGYYWVSSYVADLLDPSCNDLYEELIYVYCTSGCYIDPSFTIYDYNNCEYEFFTDYIYPSSGYFVAWDFGDGSYQIWTDYTYHTYASSGMYWVSVYVEDLYDPSCYASAGQFLYASCGSCYIDAEFTWYQSQIGCEYAFYTNNIYPSSGYYVDWYFGDGNWAYYYDYVYHTFASSGYYWVSSYVADLLDPTCYDLYEELIYVYCSSGCTIDAEFTWYQTQIGCEYGFYTDNIYPSSGYYVDWYFGDGNWAYYYDYVYHTFASSGYYWVSSYVEDLLDPSCNDLYEELIYVYCSSGCTIDAEFTWYQTQTGCEYAFYTDNIYPSSGYYVDWYFGDGNWAYYYDYVYHTFASSGYYWVSSYVEDLLDPSCNDLYEELIFVYCSSGCNITADFIAVDLGNCDYYFVSGTQYASAGYWVDWYVDGALYASDVDDILVSFASSGWYAVTMDVTDPLDANCYDSYGMQIYASCGTCLIDADFAWTEVVTYNYNFYTLAQYSATAYTIVWDFGDGSTAQGSDFVNHTFASAGTYIVSVGVMDIADPNCYHVTFYSVDVLGPAGPWTVTNTGVNHSILVPLSAAIDIDGVPVVPGDYLGVFYDVSGTLVCGGFILYDGTSQALTAWGDDSSTSTKDGFDPNEEFVWKIWQASTLTEYVATATYSTQFANDAYFTPNGTSGILSLNYTSIQTQILSIPVGWSMFSTYIYPVMPNLIDVFATMIAPVGQQGNVIIIKDYSGNVFWPAFGLNLIGNVDNTQGYQIKLTFAEQLTVSGTQVDPLTTPINLPAGWSLISYLRTTAAPVDLMLSPIVVDIEIVKNGNGMVYWPLWGVNAIGNMVPGEGYQVKTFNAVQYIYPANATLPTKSVFTPLGEKYNSELNTGSNMTIGIPLNAWDVIPEYGAEVGVFNGELLVGSGVFTGENMAITVWGDDPYTNISEACQDGSVLSFQSWNPDSKLEITLMIEYWSQGDGTYMDNGISVAGKMTGQEIFVDGFDLKQNMPNPCKEFTTIVLSAPEQVTGQVYIINTFGQVISEVFNGTIESGFNSFDVDVSEMATGNYFYRVISDKYVATRQMSVVR